MEEKKSKSFIVETVTPVTVQFIIEAEAADEAAEIADNQINDYCYFDPEYTGGYKEQVEIGDSQIRVIELPDVDDEE